MHHGINLTKGFSGDLGQRRAVLAAQEVQYDGLLTEFARNIGGRGCLDVFGLAKASKPAAKKERNPGRISKMPDGRIDSDVADGEWEANTTARPRRQPDDDPDAFGSAQYSKARAVREHYQARLAKIDYEERIGNLVSKDEVQVEAFNTHRVIRDAMLNIPDRTAAMLAADTNEAKCYEILATEIRKALNDFADANA